MDQPGPGLSQSKTTSSSKDDDGGDADPQSGAGVAAAPIALSTAGEKPKPALPAFKRMISIEDQDSSGNLSHTKMLIVFGSLSLTIFLSFADQVSVATATPIIAADLDAGESISWVGTSYLIANTAAQLLYGRFSDIFGRKSCLLFAFALFCFGDLLCGFSKTPAQLYVFRAFAGIGGGGLTNMSMIVVSDVTTLETRGKWQGILSVGVALGGAVGPFIGALLSERVSWRWCFWVMVPPGAAAALGIYLFLPLRGVKSNAKEKLKKIDYYGAILSLAATIFILIPLSSGGTIFAWDSAIVIALLVLGAVLVAAFVLVEWKVAPLPVMPLRLWTYRTTAIAIGTTFLWGMVHFTNTFMLPLYLQALRGMTPVQSAAYLLALLLIATFSSLGAGLLTTRTKTVLPQIRTGFAIWLIGTGLETTFNRTIPTARIIGYLLIQGFGVGLVLQTTLVAAQAGAPAADRAVVTGLRNCLRSMGGAFGLAMSNTILNNVVAARIPSSVPPAVREKVIRQISPTLPAGLDAASIEGIHAAYEAALRYIFVSITPIIGVCFLLSLCMVENPLSRTPKEAAKQQVESEPVSASSTIESEPPKKEGVSA